MKFTDTQLKQRGRAEIDFLAAMGVAGAAIAKQVNEEVDQVVANFSELPVDLDQRNRDLEAALSANQAFRIQNMLGEWGARQHGEIAISAFEEIQPELQNELDRLSHGATKIFSDDDFTAPAYWQGVEFHRTTGGWDGHPHMGYIHGEIIHRKMVGKFASGNIFQQRKAVAKLASKTHYDTILDMGCSSGHFTLALAEVYPQAKIAGVDLSLRMLEHSQRIANDNGWEWKLFQRAAEDTGFADNQFDLVSSYILLHEMPEDAIKSMFKEALRVMKPGGELLMSDVTRYADLSPLEQWRADRGAMYGGEPHWRESASLDFHELLSQLGFDDVSVGGMDGQKYPYVIQARKPNEQRD